MSEVVDAKPAKVTVQLQPVADAPILKQKKFTVDASRDIAWLTLTVRKMLNLTPDQSLFFYISQTFAPSPDHVFSVLRDCYSVKSLDGKDDVIQLQYSTTHAWG